MTKKTSKKSQVDIQFNWIFVMIAGFIILLFFIGIVTKQKDLSKMEISSSKATELRSIITAAQVSTDTKDVIDLPDIYIEFVCDANDVSQFRVQGAASINLPTEAVFSPDLIQGEKIITKAVDFSAPFKITNLLFLTSPDIRYIFVFESNDFAQSIFNKMPADIYKEQIIPSALQSIKNNKNYKVKFIFFDAVPSSVPQKLADMPNKDVSAITLSQTSSVINFYKKQGAFFVLEGNSFHLADSMLSGAIFSENKEYYECAMRKVFRRFIIVSSIYAERELFLKIGGCGPYYQNNIQALHNQVVPCELNINNCIGLLPAIKAVQDNNLLLKTKSCPLVY